jgi:hypothetical protein
MVKSMACPRCHDARWVCEAHMDRPWGIAGGCACGQPGAPCPVCNRSRRESPPQMPEAYRSLVKERRHRHRTPGRERHCAIKDYPLRLLPALGFLLSLVGLALVAASFIGFSLPNSRKASPFFRQDVDSVARMWP